MPGAGAQRVYQKMRDRAFSLCKPTLNGLVLLESQDPSPVEKPKALRLAGRKAGKVLETIGRVDSPLYVAALETGVKPEQLKGKRLTIDA